MAAASSAAGAIGRQLSGRLLRSSTTAPLSFTAAAASLSTASASSSAEALAGARKLSTLVDRSTICSISPVTISRAKSRLAAGPKSATGTTPAATGAAPLQPSTILTSTSSSSAPLEAALRSRASAAASARSLSGQAATAASASAGINFNSASGITGDKINSVLSDLGKKKGKGSSAGSESSGGSVAAAFSNQQQQDDSDTDANDFMDEQAAADPNAKPTEMDPMLKALERRIRENLSLRGIKKLFPVQEQVFSPVMEGQDVIVRSKTGSGKTLAFAIPVAERILQSLGSGRRRHGRSPLALVVVPTRELAKQVANEFQWLTAGCDLSVATIYGGVAYNGQESQLGRGVDIVVATPGRVIDHLERNTLDLSNVQFSIFDEADRMLEIGFKEQLDTILKALPKEKRQTLLFSATMPDWVRRVSQSMMRTPLTLDLVGEDTNKVPVSVKHIAVEVPQGDNYEELVADLLRVHCMTRAIIFSDSKEEASRLAVHQLFSQDAVCIHGDISQNMRERSMAAFRNGTYQYLFATDVAARGLDVPEVDTVIHLKPPRDVESYIHRSGRCGRAGRSGTAFLLYNPRRDMHQLRTFAREIGIRFIHGSHPSEAEIIAASALKGVKEVDSVAPEALGPFRGPAEKLYEQKGIDALAAALAALSGHKKAITVRSLLTKEAGWRTVRVSNLKNTGGGQLDEDAVGRALDRYMPQLSRSLRHIRLSEREGEDEVVLDMKVDEAEDLMETLEEVVRKAKGTTDGASTVPKVEAIASEKELPEYARYDPNQGGSRFSRPWQQMGGRMGDGARARQSFGGGGGDRGDRRGGGGYGGGDRGGFGGGGGRRFGGGGGGGFGGGGGGGRWGGGGGGRGNY